RHDAELLEDYLKTETDSFMRQRYTFYPAQSWRDCGEDWQAYKTYRERAKMGGWHEEIYLSLLYAARLLNSENDSITTLDLYKQAIAVNPKRAEAIHDAARICRLNRLYNEGYAIAKQGVRLPLWRGLFVEAWIYAYGVLDEFALCAYYTDQHVESWLACQMILRGDGLTDATRKRIEENAAFATI
ncbi:MAG: hypothetical protein J2P37_35200, partial [Ktedonobacteraceae bacterium]|nr:hypothetical protein [Ktedonobacteraceae bacterium]